MHPAAPAQTRPARNTPAPSGWDSMSASLLLHTVAFAALLGFGLRATAPAPVPRAIEMLVLPRPPTSPPAPPVPAEPSKPPKPLRPARAALPAAPPAPATPPPIVRDENALAQSDTLAPPESASAVAGTLPPGPVRASEPTPVAATGPSLLGKLTSVTRLTRMPVLTVARKPEYTPEMKRHNVSGRLKAKVLVDSDGKVKDAAVLSDPGHGSRESGLDALLALQFDPGYADGAAVAVWIPFTITFEWQE